jgi:hypothetical protein
LIGLPIEDEASDHMSFGRFPGFGYDQMVNQEVFKLAKAMKMAAGGTSHSHGHLQVSQPEIAKALTEDLAQVERQMGNIEEAHQSAVGFTQFETNASGRSRKGGTVDVNKVQPIANPASLNRLLKIHALNQGRRLGQGQVRPALASDTIFC